MRAARKGCMCSVLTVVRREFNISPADVVTLWTSDWKFANCEFGACPFLAAHWSR